MAEGGLCNSGNPLILMGDWCGEETLTDTNARNPGIGEDEASTGAARESTDARRGNNDFGATGYSFPLTRAF
jgi:hypothetical protein